MTEKEMIEEMAKVIDDRLIEANNYLGSMNKGTGYWIAQKLVEHYQPNIPESSVVLTKEEYAEYVELRNSEVGELVKENRELGKQCLDWMKLYHKQLTKTNEARKETAREFYIAIIALINNAEDKLPKIFPNNSEYKNGYENSVKHFKENIIKIAKQYGVEE